MHVFLSPILSKQQKYLKFYFRGKIYKFASLPNDLCSSPRKFTKLLKPLLSYLRLQQVTVAGFIDDLIILGGSFIKCEKNIKIIATLLDSLGFVVHPDIEIKFLGFVTDFQSMTIALTQKKKASIKQLCQEVLQEEFLIIRKIARLLGKFTSVSVHYTTDYWNAIKFSHSHLSEEILTKIWNFHSMGK